MKVNENRHPGSSAFDPPLHQDSSFLYEVTGSNPSRAINSVHPRQARCLSILWKFRHNIRKEHAGERLLTANLGYWSKRFWTNIVSLWPTGYVCEQIILGVYIVEPSLSGTITQRRLVIWPHVWCCTAPMWPRSVTRVLRVVFEVIQIYYGDSKNWTSALLRGALSLLRPELSKIMKPTAKSCLASARTGKAEASVFPSKVRLQKMID